MGIQYKTRDRQSYDVEKGRIQKKLRENFSRYESETGEGIFVRTHGGCSSDQEKNIGGGDRGKGTGTFEPKNCGYH